MSPPSEHFGRCGYEAVNKKKGGQMGKEEDKLNLSKTAIAVQFVFYLSPLELRSKILTTFPYFLPIVSGMFLASRQTSDN